MKTRMYMNQCLLVSSSCAYWNAAGFFGAFSQSPAAAFAGGGASLAVDADLVHGVDADLVHGKANHCRRSNRWPVVAGATALFLTAVSCLD